MKQYLDNRHYDVTSCRDLVQEIAQELKKRVVRMGANRHRIVTYVIIGQKDSNSLSLASRCLWNDNYDVSVEYSYKNGDLFGTALVFGLYFE